MRFLTKTVWCLFARWPEDNMFLMTCNPIVPETLKKEVANEAAGGFCSFEGWVRNHNHGRRVTGLFYEAYAPLAQHEVTAIMAEASQQWAVLHIACAHRIGTLSLTDIAVWVGVSSVHRKEAFLACQYVIDNVKHRVPIWKKEYYEDGTTEWVHCARCAEPPPSSLT